MSETRKCNDECECECHDLGAVGCIHFIEWLRYNEESEGEEQ